ncbi:aminophospholipid-transporting P-type ATPase [Cantharellus anzutake]|uniref:aminophospholipid-transporting P-type ATPase n=1 Tax=Cantharellus anzutake TaxID=1750568 RepID=UPI0019089D9D|nr:aminophospholipid-transporting P-type ATPase [Cantharellus anzutake]KAF8328688.1 aminophospholipid-transporting P-type ATPase [Cantharellus anzutake]
MDLSDPEKNISNVGPEPDASDPTRLRVEFGQNLHEIEERPTGVLTARSGSKALEIKRELTQEDKELSRANYEHLEQVNSEAGANARGDGKFSGSSEITEHTLSIEELAATLEANFDRKDPSKSLGLTTETAEARLAQNGPNILTPPKKRSAFQKYLDCLKSLFNVLLIFAGILEYILLGVDYKNNKPNEYLGGVLIVVAFLNAFIEWYQLQKSEAILAGFLAMIPPNCTVLRSGALATVPAASLVIGDVVLLRNGDKTPADCVLIGATDLKVDNSSLTGESEPQERAPKKEGDKGVRPVEASNLVFNSTNVVSGDGWGVVVRTGDNTFIGQIARLAGSESGNRSPLAVEMSSYFSLCLRFSHYNLILVVFFVVGITTAYKGKAVQTVTFAISVLVAWIPEGLPATVTLLLSIAAQRMAKEKVLVKNLQGVETLGALTCLATDKTGTLTRNEMTVTNLWSGNRMVSAFQSNNDTLEMETFHPSQGSMGEMIDIAALNSRVKFNRTDVPFEQRDILGDATETGLAKFAARWLATLSMRYDVFVKAHPKVFEIPFNSVNKWALVVVKKPHENGVLRSYIKGAPERVLEKCSTFLQDGVQHPITDEFKQKYDEAYTYMASRGHRVIGCAQILLEGKEFPEDYTFSKTAENCPTEGYCFVGLVSLEDPPKHGVRQAIGTLRQAGIKVMMITGDHPKTAEAIARKINLITGDTRERLSERTGRRLEEIYEDEVPAIVIHGDRIDSLQPYEWDMILNKNEIVFARTSPKHKLEIVRRAQALGHIVGVTGDGVNDSPALKKADLGIAMNISGSDVSKESANMILLDDNFASIVKGVKEGRLIFANLKRSIKYTVTHIMPEVIPQLLYVCVPLPLPLPAIMWVIFSINLGFEIFAALSFAWDAPESSESLMKLQPRKPVTNRSILARKQKALKRTKTILRDPETLEVIPPTKWQILKSKVKKPFTRYFWEDVWEQTEDETLVDTNLLSYAYMEAGIIETIAVLVSYFVVFWKRGFSPNEVRMAQQAGVYFTKSSPDFHNSRGWTITGPQQEDAASQSKSIVYLAIFICQCFNMFAVKAKFRPPFGKHVVSNPYNFAGIFAGACLAVFIIYTPPLHSAFNGSHHTSPLYWLIPTGFGCLLLVWASLRIVLSKRALANSLVKDIQGLQMFPTIHTMSIRR